jgi:hypothetical protein
MFTFVALNKLLGELDAGTLERIYELTYKYGWIKYDEDILGWLGEPAYIEKYRIEGDLSKVIDEGLTAMIDTYETWLKRHSPEGWKEEVQSYLDEGYDPPEALNNIFITLDRWGVNYEDKLYEIVEAWSGGSRSMLDNEDESYLKEGHGIDFLNFHKNKLTAEAYQAFDQEWEKHIDELGEDAGTAWMIDEYDLLDELKDWLINTVGWSGKDWLRDVYTSKDLIANFADPILAHLDEILDSSYDQYLDFFDSAAIAGGKSLRENVSDIENALEILQAESSGDLDQRVATFQYGLTVAHHHGTMADHLLDVGSGRGKEILDLLSSGENVEKWDKELEKVLGHPRGSIRKEVMPEWHDPEQEAEFAKLRRNQSLRLAATIAEILV